MDLLLVFTLKCQRCGCLRDARLCAVVTALRGQDVNFVLSITPSLDAQGHSGIPRDGSGLPLLLLRRPNASAVVVCMHGQGCILHFF